MEIKPAIVVVAYNRCESLNRLLDSIGNARFLSNDVPLVISIDYSNVNEKILEIANAFEWKYGEKRIINHSSNLGLRKHILKCGDLSKEFGAVIILEDDLVVAPDFYNYVCCAQDYYKNDENIAGVSLYSHEWNGYVRKPFEPIAGNGDVYFGQFSITWGQSWTWKQWNLFKSWYSEHQELKKQNNMPDNIWKWSVHSWGKYFVYYILEKNKFYVIPYKSMTTCFSEEGVHTGNMLLDNQVALFMGNKKYEFPKFEEGMHYDIYFENMDLVDTLNSDVFDKENMCIDLYAKKEIQSEKVKYLLSTRKMEAPIIKKFGLQMRPWELNVIYNIKGEGIYLYQLDANISKKKHIDSFEVLNYVAKGMSWQNGIIYGVMRAFMGIKAILLNRKK